MNPNLNHPSFWQLDQPLGMKFFQRCYKFGGALAPEPSVDLVVERRPVSCEFSVGNDRQDFGDDFAFAVPAR